MVEYIKQKNNSKRLAATHTLELPFVFGKSILVYDFNPNAEDVKKIEEFTTALTNFIKTGWVSMCFKKVAWFFLSQSLFFSNINVKKLYWYYRSPNKNWRPYDLNDHNSYYWFGQNSTQDGMQRNFCVDRMLKWKQLYEKYGIEC